MDDLWKAGKLASTGWMPISAATQAEADLKKVLPNAETEIFILSSCARRFENNCLQTDYRANNSIVIPAASKNIDRTMAFFDWLFASRENHDLFQYGIIGKHWKPEGDDQYKELDQIDNYRFPGYELTWNLNYFRMNADASDEVKKILTYASKPESYKPKKLAGFVFNTEPVKLQLVQVQPKLEAFNEIAHAGLAGKGADFDAAAGKMNDELRGLGLEEIRAELKRQIQEYLDSNAK
jgi:putative aldouronate transport system substrate-binding protein